jgi:hypothetical protein
MLEDEHKSTAMQVIISGKGKKRSRTSLTGRRENPTS